MEIGLIRTARASLKMSPKLPTICCRMALLTSQSLILGFLRTGLFRLAGCALILP
nr:hypothetical protein [Acetobacter malorum]